VGEETGLELEINALIGVYAKREERDLVFLFVGSAVGGELRTSDERDRVEFVKPRHQPSETSDRDRERIEDALDEPRTPILSIQASQRCEPPNGTR